jgi:putative peptidoglycan lipid II flippase
MAAVRLAGDVRVPIACAPCPGAACGVTSIAVAVGSAFTVRSSRAAEIDPRLIAGQPCECLAHSPLRREKRFVSKKLKDIGIVSLLTVISRVLGLVRDQVGAAIFGGSLFNDAFLTAFSLPNLFRRLLGEGALTAAFIPTLQEELRARNEAGAFQLLNRVASWVAVVTGGIVVLAMIGFSHSRLLPGHEDKWYFAADLTVIMFPYMAFVCLAATFNATLNVLQRFTEPALSPIWLNVAMIASLAGAGLHFAHTPLGEVRWLCAGVLIGGFLQMTVPAAVLVHGGWRPRFELGLSPQVRQIAALMAPALFGTAIYQINTFVSRVLAYSLPESTATLMFYANRLMELPIGVFAIAVSTVVYPLIARHAAAKNMEAMSDDFRKGLRLILIINTPAAVGLALLSERITRLIYQHGAFTAENTHAMATLLTLFVIGLPFFSVVNLTVRGFYAVKDTSTPVKIAAIDFGVNLVLSLALKNWLGAPGLVIASTTAIVVQTFLLQRSLVRKWPGMSFAPLAPTIAKVLAASAVMGVIVWIAGFGLDAAGIGRRGDWLAVFGIIPVGVAVYGATLWSLRIEGREDIAAVWAKLRRKAA